MREPRARRWLRSGVVASGLLAAVILQGCGARETPVEAGIRTQTLEAGVLGEPSEVDPHIINAPPDFRIVFALFEGLVTPDPVTLQARPGVAERWELSEDRLTYTFSLRNTARWSDGTPVTAQDFLFSFQRALTPALGSQYTFLFSRVRGADDFAAGRTTDFSTVGFAAPDAHTLRITLSQPTPFFLEIIANNPVWYPVPRAAIERAGGIAQRGSGWTRPEHFVGNGPFVLKEWQPNELLRADRSPTYWRSGDVRLQTIHFRPMDTTAALERAFRAGQLHTTDRALPERADVFRRETPSSLREGELLMVRFVNLNTARPPLDDVRVRQALALALDRSQLASRVFSGAATPALGVVPRGMPGYQPAEQIVEDVAQAQRLLAAAGFPGGRGFPPVEMQVENVATSKLDEALQAAWRENLGIDVRIIRSESRVHWSNLQQRNFVMSIGGWVADYPDATAVLDIWGTGSGWNFTGWNSAQFDSALREANEARTATERRRFLQQAEAALIEQMPVVPIWFERSLQLIHPAVQGWQQNVMERPDFAQLRLTSAP